MSEHRCDACDLLGDDFRQRVNDLLTREGRSLDYAHREALAIRDAGISM